MVISLAQPHFSRIEVKGERMFCGAGAKLKNVAVEAKRNGLAGLEFMEGIPGTVGGALRMNAGAMTGATFDVVEGIRMMDYAGKIIGAERNNRLTPGQQDFLGLLTRRIAVLTRLGVPPSGEGWHSDRRCASRRRNSGLNCRRHRG